MSQSKYPKTLHHPRLAGIVRTVHSEEQEASHRQQGWLVNAPAESKTVAAGERVTETK